MQAANDKIIVKVELDQKDGILLNGVRFHTAIKYESNYREKSPVIATVVSGNNKDIMHGDVLLCHHNLFYLPSPHYLYDNLYSIKIAPTLFAKILQDGSLLPICGNLLCERVEKQYSFEVPVENREMYLDRIKVINAGYTPYKTGQLLFTRPYSYYEIVYNFGEEEMRIHKCHESMVVAYLKK